MPNKKIDEINNSKNDKEDNKLFDNSYKQFLPLLQEYFDHLCANINTVIKFTNNKNLIYSILAHLDLDSKQQLLYIIGQN